MHSQVVESEAIPLAAQKRVAGPANLFTPPTWVGLRAQRVVVSERLGNRSTRPESLGDPFPTGESYQEVVDRVSAWLTEAVPGINVGTILVIGHRGTFFALEHLLKQVTLHEAVT